MGLVGGNILFSGTGESEMLRPWVLPLFLATDRYTEEKLDLGIALFGVLNLRQFYSGMRQGLSCESQWVSQSLRTTSWGSLPTRHNRLSLCEPFSLLLLHC